MNMMKNDDNYHIDKIKEQRKALKSLATIEIAKKDFWYFCRAMDEKFFANVRNEGEEFEEEESNRGDAAYGGED